MNRNQRLRAGRLAALAGALSLFVGGCNHDTGTPEKVVAAQEAGSAAWAKAKAEGKDTRKAPRSPENTKESTGRRGHVNKPGG